VLWNNGVITNLTPDLVSTEFSSATGINESGQIVGNIGQSVAFLWQNGARTPLGHLGGGGSFVSDINDSGVAVGSSTQHPFAWQNGVMTDLGLLDGDEDGGAAAINGAGQIVGSSGFTNPDTYEQTYRAFLYSNGAMTALPCPARRPMQGTSTSSASSSAPCAQEAASPTSTRGSTSTAR
jgi:probable HAF family extracellular repeat protein